MALPSVCAAPLNGSSVTDPIAIDFIGFGGCGGGTYGGGAGAGGGGGVSGAGDAAGMITGAGGGGAGGGVKSLCGSLLVLLRASRVVISSACLGGVPLLTAYHPTVKRTVNPTPPATAYARQFLAWATGGVLISRPRSE
jgi:hypothetical protein